MVGSQSFIVPSGAFSTSGTKTEPDASKRAAGMAVNEGLPYEYFNYYIYLLTANAILIDASVNEVILELTNVLSAASIVVDPETHTQVLSAVQWLTRNITTGVVNITDSTESTTYSDGALIVSGGVGIAKNLNVHGTATLENLAGNFVRGASVIIASSDSLTNSKNAADVVISTSSDAGESINAQITALNSAGGGTIQLMEGTYNFTTNLLPLSNVTIRGMGFSTVLKRNINTLQQIIYIANSVDYCNFYDFKIDGNPSLSYTGYSYGIYNYNSTTNLNGSFNNIYSVVSIGTSNSHNFYNCNNLNNCFAYSSGSSVAGAFGFAFCKNLNNCISNILVSTAVTGYGFSNCNNLTNCIGTGNGTEEGYGFSDCDNLTNCIGLGVGGAGGSGKGYGFYTCNNLINCTGTGTGVWGEGVGFRTCVKIANCIGTGTGDYDNCGFSNCIDVLGCTGTGTGNNGGSGYGFYACKHVSFCTGTGFNGTPKGFKTCYVDKATAVSINNASNNDTSALGWNTGTGAA